jgi:hypothetical protein
MEDIKQNCDAEDTDWAREPLITLMDAAEAGVESAKKELEKRQLEMARDLNDLANNTIDTVTPKFPE